MPLEQRVVDPITVSRDTLPLDSQGNLAVSIPNELECVTNGTLANIIRQLSSLSNYAEDLFGGIFQEASSLITRTNSLQGRIDRLSNKVTQLDSSVEEVSLHDIHLRKPFKSYHSYEQQVVSRVTMPLSLVERYNLCDKPPPLDKLNPYREDGRDGLKFYTDPNYFFELWKQEMLSQTRVKGERVMKPKHGKEIDGKNRKKPSRPGNRIEYYQNKMEKQEFLKPEDGNNAIQYNLEKNGHAIYAKGHEGQRVRPDSLELELNQQKYEEYLRYNNHKPLPGYESYHQQQQQAPPPSYNSIANYQYAHQQQQQQQAGNQYHPQMGSPARHSGTNQMNNSTPPPVGYQMDGTIGQGQVGTPTRKPSLTAHRPSQPPPAPPIVTPSPESSPYRRGPSIPRDHMPPPPPPPPPSLNDGMVGYTGMNGEVIQTQSSPIKDGIGGNVGGTNSAPPPPPPPPPNNIAAGDMNVVDGGRNEFASELLKKGGQLKPAKLSTQQKVLPPNVRTDARSDMLAAIREGIKLRRVQDIKEKEVEKSALANDVASILQRRVHMELSSEDEEEGSCSDGWDVDSVC